MRRAISVQQRVAITLWCLATPAEYCTIAHLFGVARSTVCQIVHETSLAIVRTLMTTYIKFPTGNQLERVIETFQTKWGVPQCVGAIDGCHIPIAAPVGNHTDYYNRKGWYSMILQGVVDADYCFSDICIGWPGSVHDGWPGSVHDGWPGSVHDGWPGSVHDGWPGSVHDGWPGSVHDG